MASLAESPELVGFFSYSRRDEQHTGGALSLLRARIHDELRLQLGREFRLWQDTAAIPEGALWEDEIKRAIAESAFFIPIVTPSAVASGHCRFEFESFLQREGALGRNNLIFPLLYVRVPALEHEEQWRSDDVLKIIGLRQYVDWQDFRHRDPREPEVARKIGQYCRSIVETLRQPWVSPEEQRAAAACRREQAEAEERAKTEQERIAREAEERRRTEKVERERLAREAEGRRRAEAAAQATEQQRAKAEQKRVAREAEERWRAEEAARVAEQRRANDAERERKATELEARQRSDAERRRQIAEATPGAEEVKHRPRPMPRPAVLVGSAVAGVAALVAVVWIGAPGPRRSIEPAPVATEPSVVTAGGVRPLSLERERALQPKESLKECTECPEMVVVPAGRFMMGSWNESPEHAVTFARPFAVGRFALTFEEWDVCSADGGCDRFRPVDQGWGRGRRPVVGVSWDEAKAYVAWLGKKTGKPYRLLSEAEREYVTRAGTTTDYFWGDQIGKGNANCASCGSQWDNKQTAPVGSFQANAFGLYDVHGNVWEWVEDCWTKDYDGAPSDGSARNSGDCGRRGVRGGSWQSRSFELRSAARDGYTSFYRSSDLSFRVARTLAH